MKYLDTFKKELKTPLGKITLVALIIAFLLAIVPFSEQLFFYYDQARDAYEAYNIWHFHDIKILGPGTDIAFLHHGVLWYYLLAILYSIFQQAVLPVAIIFLLAFFITLPVIWILAKDLFDNKKVAAIALILYAFSPLFQLSTRWLSNPTLSLLCMPFLLLVLWRYITKQTTHKVLLLGILYGVVIQSQLAFVILLLFLPVYFLVFRLKVRFSHVVLFLVGLATATSTIILGEVKYHFQGVISLIHFISSPHSTHKSLLLLIQSMIAKINELLTVSIFSLPVLLPLLIILILFVFVYKKSQADRKALIFILIWLTNLLLFCLFDTGISRSLFVFYPSLVMIIILSSYLLEKAVPQKYLLVPLTLGIIISQVWLDVTWIKNTVNPLTVQRGITLSNEEKVLEYTYESSSKKPFTINTVTEPLFINTTWAYLYNFYGKKKYGYTPYWNGKDQTGNLGKLPLSTSSTEFRYLIIEPTTGIPDFFVKTALDEENAKSKVIEEKHIGNFVVQKRKTIDALK